MFVHRNLPVLCALRSFADLLEARRFAKSRRFSEAGRFAEARRFAEVINERPWAVDLNSWQSRTHSSACLTKLTIVNCPCLTKSTIVKLSMSLLEPGHPTGNLNHSYILPIHSYKPSYSCLAIFTVATYPLILSSRSTTISSCEMCISPPGAGVRSRVASPTRL